MSILDKLKIDDLDNEMDVISTNSYFVGNFVFGKLARIDGKIEGSIQSYGVLIVSNNAYIKADIKGETVVIKGTLYGNIKAQKTIIIDYNASVKGDLEAPVIIINHGGKIDGEILMSNFHPELSMLKEI